MRKGLLCVVEADLSRQQMAGMGEVLRTSAPGRVSRVTSLGRNLPDSTEPEADVQFPNMRPVA